MGYTITQILSFIDIAEFMFYNLEYYDGFAEDVSANNLDEDEMMSALITDLLDDFDYDFFIN